MHDDLDRRILATIDQMEEGPDTAPAAGFIQAVSRRRRARRARAGGALAVALVLGGVLHLLSRSPSPADGPEGPAPRIARSLDRPSFGALAGDPDWLARSISLVGFSDSRGDEPPIALRMSRDDEAIDRILDRMMSGS